MYGSVKHWKDWLTLNSARTTIAAYAYEIDRIGAFYPGRDPIELNLNDLTAYLAQRKIDGLGLAALYRATNALRSFYKFHFGSESPAKLLPLRKPPFRQ